MIDLKKLKQEQLGLQKQIKLNKLPKINLIAGCDSSLIGSYRNYTQIFSVFVVFTYPELQEIEVQTNISPLTFPYIPGFLSFREIPNLLKVYKKIENKPDLIMVDGSGLIHPRHMGIAKKKLYGNIVSDKIIDPKTNEQLGFSVKTKARANPIFVSPGTFCDLESSLSITLSCLKGYKLPEPTRIADLYSKKLKNVQK
ncbi:MAG TPA: endonuclease V [Patescibacteria group bacterium]|nr:endonuclease V [Patescibacteria group bacterium]